MRADLIWGIGLDRAPIDCDRIRLPIYLRHGHLTGSASRCRESKNVLEPMWGPMRAARRGRSYMLLIPICMMRFTLGLTQR